MKLTCSFVSLHLNSVVDPDIQMAGGGGEGERSFRPEIRGMPGLQKNIFGPFGP